ncbi:F0F1-type ATP synthase, beta subunit [Thiovulum sp. ES]|nr:F0F1-type ATP synthase, beta subunit [Thiovulum sp. ES]
MLDINPILLVITLAVFVFLIKYLTKNLYDPLLKYMDDREARLENDRNSVSQNSSEIDSLRKEAQETLAKARAEAISIKEKTISEAKESISKRFQEKKDALAKDYDAFQKALVKEKSGIKTQLMSNSRTFEEALKGRFASI